MSISETPVKALEISQLAHRVYGEKSPGIPLVLLHGLMGYASNWGKIWPAFADSRPVLTYDQRGHGRSGKPQNAYSPAHYAEDLKALMDHLGWKQVHLCGHSMGGRVSMHFAANFPERVKSLTLEDSGAFGNPGALTWIENLLNRVPTPFTDRDSAKAYFDSEFKDDPLVGGFLHANIERKEDGGYSWRFSKDAMIETIEFGRSTNCAEEYSQIQCPILIIHGERSTHLSKDEIQKMIDLNPSRTKAITIKGAGHFVHPMKPEEFNRELAAFIDE